MQAINLLPRSVQDLAKCGQPPHIFLLQNIDTDYVNFCKYIHHHIKHTKAGYDDYTVIDLTILKRITLSNPSQYSY